MSNTESEQECRICRSPRDQHDEYTRGCPVGTNSDGSTYYGPTRFYGRAEASEPSNIYSLGAEEARRDAKEFARLAKLTDNENVKAWLISAASGALVAAKVMDESPGPRAAPDGPSLT